MARGQSRPPQICGDARNEGELRDDKGHAFSLTLTEVEARAAGIPESMSFTNEGLRVVGSPVGTGDFVAKYVGEQIDGVIGAFETLARMPLLHAQHSILQKSLLTKMTYLQRTLATGAPFSQVAVHGRRYDAALRRLVQGFVPHTHLHDQAYTQLLRTGMRSTPVAF